MFILYVIYKVYGTVLVRYVGRIDNKERGLFFFFFFLFSVVRLGEARQTCAGGEIIISSISPLLLRRFFLNFLLLCPSSTEKQEKRDIITTIPCNKVVEYLMKCYAFAYRKTFDKKRTESFYETLQVYRRRSE